MEPQEGKLRLSVIEAKGIKERHWNCRQDPYCIIKAGRNEARTRAIPEGGRDPVWHETFDFSLSSEDCSLQVHIHDGGKLAGPKALGVVDVPLDRVRTAGSEKVTLPVRSTKSKKQHGTLTVALSWTPRRDTQTATTATATPTAMQRTSSPGGIPSRAAAAIASTAAAPHEDHSSRASPGGPAALAAAVGCLPKYVNYAPPGAPPVYAEVPLGAQPGSHQVFPYPTSKPLLAAPPMAAGSSRPTGPAASHAQHTQQKVKQGSAMPAGTDEMIAHVISIWRNRRHAHRLANTHGQGHGPIGSSPAGQQGQGQEHGESPASAPVATPQPTAAAEPPRRCAPPAATPAADGGSQEASFALWRP